jgi:hypothetical protein
MPILTITKNYDDGLVPTEQMLDDIKNSIEIWANTTKLNSDNLQSSAATTAKYAALSVDALALGASSITTAKIADGSITQLKRAELTYSSGVTSSTFTSTSSSYVDIDNLSVSFTSTGRPVQLMLVPADPSAVSGIAALNSSSGTAITYFKFIRDSTDLCEIVLGEVKTGASNSFNYMPVSSLQHIDVPSAGTYTYKVQGKISTGSSFECLRARLVAYEL